MRKTTLVLTTNVSLRHTIVGTWNISRINIDLYEFFQGLVNQIRGKRFTLDARMHLVAQLYRLLIGHLIQRAINYLKIIGRLRKPREITPPAIGLREQSDRSLISILSILDIYIIYIIITSGSDIFISYCSSMGIVLAICIQRYHC